MKKIVILSFLLVIITTILLLPKQTTAKSYFKSFGGKVVSIAINGGSIVCNGTGKLIFLSSNAFGLTKVATSQAEPKGYSKASGTAQGIYESIPYYTNNVLKEPKVGGWILGKAKAVPDLSICRLNLGEIQIPIPVLVTEKYNVSKKIR